MSRLINIPPDFCADLQLWSSEQSRRTNPLLPGFRGLVRFENSDEDVDVEIVPRAGALPPGERGEVDVRFLFRDQQYDIDQGQIFSLREGATEIGTGSVLPEKAP